jgi:hypothetical protein
MEVPTPVAAPEPLQVPVELAQSIMNYMTARPYLEVHQLVAELVKCKAKEVEDVRND